MFEQELEHVRKISTESGCFSWTSPDYQRDILGFLIEYREHGAGVIEVGCYKGGLTAQIGLICRKFGWPLWTMDINQASLETAADLLRKLGLDSGVTFHLGPLDHFVQHVKVAGKPVLIILDGDHQYDAVVKDILSLYRLAVIPYAAAFHDFSLRHPTSGEKVSQSVKDCFGSLPVRHIGARMDGTGPYPTKEKPSEDGHWWEIPGSEGAIVSLPAKLGIRARAMRALRLPALRR